MLLEAALAEKEPAQGLMDSPGSGGWKGLTDKGVRTAPDETG